ncbi:uncharacterized protein LOC128956874 [Oppia nitens]|uniref:uncharacterized protein LOC128956874 n=1 Tax=Oppia nitens TaxID=1686743 RepID=UPI0023DBF4B2|nr:uncharacterized protein LOC128956874 [Oppia nitens]
MARQIDTVPHDSIDNTGVSIIDSEASQVLSGIIDRVVEDNNNNNNTTHETAVKQVLADMVDKVVSDDNHQYIDDHRPELNATLIRRPRARNRTKTIETDRYIPPPPSSPAPVLNRTKSTNQLPNQLSNDFYGQLQTKTTGQQQQHLLLNQLRMLAPRPPTQQQQAFMTGPGPHLFMSALDGYYHHHHQGTGTGSQQQVVNKGELFQHNVDDNNIQSLTDNDYQLLCQELANYGLILGQETIGQGRFGSVVIGTYGPNLSNLMAVEAEYLNSGLVGQRFAAKYIHFTGSTRPFQRARLNMEKLVWKHLGRHPNCLTYRLAISLGPAQLCTYMDDSFLSYDHTLLIMDYADHGDLFDFLTNDKSVYTVGTCIQFMQDLLHGLQYIHGLGITHSDIHTGNVLIFTTTTTTTTTTSLLPVPGIPGYVAKWSDFGLSQIQELAGHQYRTDDQHRRYLCRDLASLSELFTDTLIKWATAKLPSGEHYNDQHPELLLLKPWTQLADDLLKIDGNINVIYDRYPDLI